MSGLCGGSQPPVGHPAGEKAKKQTVRPGREGTWRGEDRKNGKDKEKRERRRGERTDGNGLCEGDTPNAHVTKLAEDSKVDPAGFGWFHFI